jgi:hypothetical protein
MTASASERFGYAALALAVALAVVARPSAGAEPGDGNHARPALLNVPVAAAVHPGGVAAALDVGAGVTEPLVDADEPHQRLGLGAAASVNAARWLNVGLSANGRYDRHGKDDDGRDDGFLLQSDLSLRAAWQSGRLGWGAELSAWLPSGRDIGTSFTAVSGDARVLVTHHGERLVLSGYAGYRFDRSAKAATDAERLRFGDRIALGASDFDAALVGIGVGYTVGRSLLFCEATSRLLLGAPELVESPSFLSVGVRHPLGTSGLALEVSLSGLLSPRPDDPAGEDLIPIEPRGLLNIGLRYRFGETEPAPPRPLPPAPPPAKPAVVVQAPPKPTSVELALRDDQGQPLQRATVTLIQGERETPLSERTPGRYGSEGIEPGPAKLRIVAEGFQPVERDITIGAGRSEQVEVQAQQALPAGQVRGLVRSLRGKAVSAKIRVEPAGGETQTDPEGFFQIDVPPGEYEVVIEAAGYQSQRRAVKVEKQGVVIVNADLGQGKP